MLTELVTNDVLEHVADGTYVVGIWLWEVAVLSPRCYTNRIVLVQRGIGPLRHGLRREK